MSQILISDRNELTNQKITGTYVQSRDQSLFNHQARVISTYPQKIATFYRKVTITTEPSELENKIYTTAIYSKTVSMTSLVLGKLAYGTDNVGLSEGKSHDAAKGGISAKYYNFLSSVTVISYVDPKSSADTYLQHISSRDQVRVTVHMQNLPEISPKISTYKKGIQTQNFEIDSTDSSSRIFDIQSNSNSKTSIPKITDTYFPKTFQDNFQAAYASEIATFSSTFESTLSYAKSTMMKKQDSLVFTNPKLFIREQGVLASNGRKTIGRKEGPDGEIERNIVFDIRN